MAVRLLASWRSGTTIVLRPSIKQSASDRIRGAVEVVRGIDGPLDLLPGTVEYPPAGVEPDEVLVELVLVVEMLRKSYRRCRPDAAPFAQAPEAQYLLVPVPLSVTVTLKSLSPFAAE
jgi:hypothetical protein